jgi:hypothetical protein
MTALGTRGKQFLVVVGILILVESGAYFFLKKDSKTIRTIHSTRVVYKAICSRFAIFWIR